jgi:hypothetical protein
METTKTDFTCPNCRRVRRRESKAETMVFKCSCVGRQLIQCPRVKLELADWTLLDEPLADALGVGIHYVRAKRAELGKPHGTLGRKKYSQRIRRVDASLIDPKKSVKENAEKLNCTPQRIRQLQKEMNQTTP